jgi:FAD/FMN-containing dehydrogenase
MEEVKALTTKGELATLGNEELEALQALVRGCVILPTSETYETARKIWNAMIDRRPALIVQCTGHADVVQAVKFARKHNLRVTVRSGGHQFAGRSIYDNCMLIDLSKLRSVMVNHMTKRVWVSPGATLGDIDHETVPFNLGK